MPYKDPEHKRQWEREHREQRNRRRREQRLDARSGQPNVSKATSGLTAILYDRARKQPNLSSDQKPKEAWKTVLGWTVGIGVVLLSAFAGVSSFNANDFGTRGSGDS